MDAIHYHLTQETSASIVEWFITSLTRRDFDEPTSHVPIAVHRKITDEAVSCLIYTPTKREEIRAGNAVAIISGVMITEEEYRSIQELGYVV